MNIAEKLGLSPALVLEPSRRTQSRGYVYLLGHEEAITVTVSTKNLFAPPATPLVAPEVAAPGAPGLSLPVMGT
jgi:hypothetical protein